MASIGLENTDWAFIATGVGLFLVIPKGNKNSFLIIHGTDSFCISLDCSGHRSLKSGGDRL